MSQILYVWREMFDLFWRARTIDPAVIIILAVSATLFTAIAALVIAPRGLVSKSQKVIRWSLVVPIWLVTYVGFCNLLDRFGKRPDAIYVLQRDAAIRITVAGDIGQRGSVCFVRTATLDKRLVGRARRSGRCRVRDHAAWQEGGASMRFMDLWAGEFGPTLRELASRQGSLPGSGELSLISVEENGAWVRLQDGTTRLVPLPSSDGMRRMSSDERSTAVKIPGVHAPAFVRHDCCEGEGCGSLLSFSDVAFGSGNLYLGLLRENPEAPAPQILAWSLSTRELFGAEAAATGAFRLAGENLCVVVAGLPGYRVGLAFLDFESGSVVRRELL